MKSDLFLKAVLGLSLIASSISFAETENWGAYIGLGKKSTDTKIRPEVFVPVMKSDDEVVFFDLRNVDMLQNGDALNISFGWRKKYNDTILGINANHDTYRSENGNQYIQNGLGLEVLREDISLRVNFYAPTGVTKNDLAGTGVPLYARLNGSKFELVDKRDTLEGALGGYDFELGGVLAREQDRNLKGYLGAWHRNGNGRLQSSNKYYAELEVNQELLGGTLSFNIRKEAGDSASNDLKLGIGYSFGRDDNADLDSMMTGHVRRDDTIFIATKEFETNVYDGCTELYGKEFCEITILDAEDNVAAEVTAAGENSLVLLDGSKGDIEVGGSMLIGDSGIMPPPIGIYSGLKLQDGQVLLGNGRAFTIRGPDGRTAVLVLNTQQAKLVMNNLPSITPTMFGMPTDAALEMANNSAVADLDIENDGSPIFLATADNEKDVMPMFGTTGILVDGKENVVIDNANVSGGFESGIESISSRDLTIQNSTVTDSYYGIRLSDEYLPSGPGDTFNEDIKILNTTIADTGYVGLWVDTADNLKVDGLDVTGTMGGIVMFSVDNSEFVNINSSNNQWDGIWAVNVSNSTFNNVTTNNNIDPYGYNGQGITIYNGDNVSGTNNTSNNNSNYNCLLLGPDNRVEVSGCETTPPAP